MIDRARFAIQFEINRDDIYDDLVANIPYNVFTDRYGKVTLTKFAKLKHDAILHNKSRQVRNKRIEPLMTRMVPKNAMFRPRRAIERMTVEEANAERDALMHGIEVCNNAMNSILETIDKNTITEAENRAKVNSYDDAVMTYNAELTKITRECASISTRKLTLRDNQDGMCGSQGSYGTMHKVSEVLTTPGCKPDFMCTHRDVCAYKNTANAKASCISAKMKLTKPTYPQLFDMLPVPEITCQICPNILIANASEGGEIDIDGVITQTSNCIVEKELEIARLDDIVTDDAPGVPNVPHVPIVPTVFDDGGGRSVKVAIVIALVIIILFAIA